MPIAYVIIALATFFTIQGLINLYWMLYAWENADQAKKDKSPEHFWAPKYSFTALIPARHEEKVIAATLTAVSSVNYPRELMEIIVICRNDDPETIKEVQNFQTSLDTHDKLKVRLLVCNDYPINKPHSLNWGLKYATNDVIGIFDAEDQPHPDIYSVINTVMQSQKADVVQSGVQLMNYNSNWYSTLNVLEYFFWFKSALHFFAARGVIPLGGNSVFFKKEWLQKVNGWDEECLTEDADIGIRLSIAGARIRVVYDEKHATHEETPTTLESFVRQRTRWNQGFLQIFLKWEWIKMPGLFKKLLAGYMLILPELQALMFVLMPLSVIFALIVKLPPAWALYTFVPLLILLLQISTLIVGLYEFTRDYKLPFSIIFPLKIAFFFWIYLAVLGLSAIRAISRYLAGRTNWEKTKHINAHRLPLFNVAKE